jgi:hypothetical protein
MKYTFTKTVRADQLQEEIQRSSIVTAIDHIETVGDNVDIYFKAELSVDDQNLLSSLVNSHNPQLPATPPQEVTTQYEKNDKDLKLARGKADVDPNTKIATIYLRVPGTPGTQDGRYVAGGYAISSDYHEDDYVCVFVEDKDRLIAWQVALSQDPNSTAPADDSIIQSLGQFPEYPILKSYSDTEAGIDNCGWYFWPLAKGNNELPSGECEVEPIGGYGFLPAGFYLKLIYTRPITTGSVRINYYWGKKN